MGLFPPCTPLPTPLPGQGTSPGMMLRTAKVCSLRPDRETLLPITAEMLADTVEDNGWSFTF